MRTIAVIGKNYGDEGKGLVTSSLCFFYKKSLIIKSNGGAQAGHTVENQKNGTRFVHHQIGSGAEYGADTLWAESFHPDLFKLECEMNDFKQMYGFFPSLFAEGQTCITTIDDVLINMALETMRGDGRHGSCGMGINECVERIRSGYKISLTDIKNCNAQELIERLRRTRTEYTIPRLTELGIGKSSDYYEMLTDDNVLVNFAFEITKNISWVQIVDADNSWLSAYDGLIFENGQGLLLDQDCMESIPHVTASRTGVAEPVAFLEQRNMLLDEAVYVTRTYITKHGAGPLRGEFDRTDYPSVLLDETNEPNEWQGSIRYARHGQSSDFFAPIFADLKRAGLFGSQEVPNAGAFRPSLAVTHLNETDNCIMFENGDISVDDFVKSIEGEVANIYISNDKNNLCRVTV